MGEEIGATSAQLPKRHILRALADDLGIPIGPRPAGARLIAVVFDGAEVVGDSDVTVRNGDQLICCESPAPAIDDHIRQEWYRATTLLGELLAQAFVAVFSLNNDDWALHEVNQHLPPLATPGSFLLELAIRVYRPHGLEGDDDPLTFLSEGISTSYELGDRPTAGSTLFIERVEEQTRQAALDKMSARLDQYVVGGVSTDLKAWSAVFQSERVVAGAWHPSMAVVWRFAGPVMDVIQPGMESTIQDWPGRLGAWEVGVPSSGPIDGRSFRLANTVVGNPEGTPGLEILLAGPQLRFAQDTTVAVTGATVSVSVDGQEQPMYAPIVVPAGSTLAIGSANQRGLRAYLAVRGGIAVPDYLGSASTFTLGAFGGHAGRPLVRGDLLSIGGVEALGEPAPIPKAEQPRLMKEWTIAVTLGPHAAPDFLTEEGLQEFLDAAWKVSPRSNRTGIRLDGPIPKWARTDGGEAGLHPSNLHDNGYAIGAVDFTGDTPIILGPDGPSCGGFACPVVIPLGERWKMGQVRPGDTIRWRLVDQDQASLLRARPGCVLEEQRNDPAIIQQLAPNDEHPGLTMRAVGDGYLLLEYGPPELDITLRMRVHLLDQHLRQQKITGLIDIVPGIRSLLSHVDPAILCQKDLRQLVFAADSMLDTSTARVSTRTLHLPLSWDDPSTRKATDIYQRTVNPDAPWCPWNIEFIRRINGLDSVQDVFDIVYGAEYLVMGLGDVYLGAPVATPIDPRHRLVTTKYNPARTWTPENAVGIGGAYMCIYGMEGPGGYQFVGRTVPVWNTWRSTECFEPGTPWLLRQFDRIRWYEVSHEELQDLRTDMRSGAYAPRIEEGYFDLGEYRAFCAKNAESIQAAKLRQQTAFEAERQRWQELPQ